MSEETDTPSDLLLAGRGLTKRFGSLVALRDADLELRAGHVTAIVGENGAGKSTLAKVMSGVYRADAGEIEIGTERRAALTRPQALAAGIGFVPQSLSFVGTLTALENHLLGETTEILDPAAAAAKLSAAAKHLGVSIPLNRPVEQLSLGERQLAEIVSAIVGGARVLFLDEPTSSLGPTEIEQLIGAVRRLAEEGQAVALVTHRVREVLLGADDVVVLRAGEVMFRGRSKGMRAEDVARLMVGERSQIQLAAAAPDRSVTRLIVNGLSLSSNNAPVLRNTTFTVDRGEIMGIAGVVGPTQRALADALAGLHRPDSGYILVDGKDITRDAAAAARAGVAYIPEDRSLGIVPGQDVADNAALLRMPAMTDRFGLRGKAAEAEYARTIIQRFDVRPPDPRLVADQLSGGNQQKLLVGRELDRKPSIVIAHGPTQGLDLAAAASIRTALVEAAGYGAALVVISADLDELLALCHRLIVITAEAIAGLFDLTNGPADMDAIGRAIAGAHAFPEIEATPA